MKTNHTPGPWRYDTDCGLVRESPGDDINIGSAELAEVMWVERSGMTAADSERETNANATLMASAPELLAALVNMLADDPGQCSCPNCDMAGECPACVARAAIARAEGGK